MIAAEKEGENIPERRESYKNIRGNENARLGEKESAPLDCGGCGGTDRGGKMSRIILGVDFSATRARDLPWAGAEASRSAGLIRADGFGALCRRQRGGEAQKSGADRREIAQHERLGGSEIGEVPRLCGSLEEETGIETVLYDERLTTVSAHRYLSDTGVSGKKRKKAWTSCRRR